MTKNINIFKNMWKKNPRKKASVSEPKQKAFLRGLKIYRY